MARTVPRAEACCSDFRWNPGGGWRPMRGMRYEYGWGPGGILPNETTVCDGCGWTFAEHGLTDRDARSMTPGHQAELRS